MDKRDKQKAEMQAPCLFWEWNPKKVKADVCYPQVNCNMNCKSCGWNPEEQNRRLNEGKMKPLTARKNIDTEELIFLENVNQLVFKKGGHMELIDLIRSGKYTIEDIETALKKMKLRITELEQMHQCDQAEIIRLRRWIQRLEDGNS